MKISDPYYELYFRVQSTFPEIFICALFELTTQINPEEKTLKSRKGNLNIKDNIVKKQDKKHN